MSLALVLLDLQKGILQSPAIHWEDPSTPSRTIAAAGRVLTAARDAGALVVHVGVQRPHRRGTSDVLRTANARTSGRSPRDILALAPGSEEVAFVVAPATGEEIVYKVGVSAFQGTRLDALLRNAAATDVLVAGAFTHMVVESTVRQGFDLGYRMAVIEDACCAPASAPHQSAMSVGIPAFADVTRSDEAVRWLTGGRPSG
jgi:nicotinamidase-related amidase